MLLRYFFRVLEIGRLRQTTAPGAEPVEHVIGERERANLVGDFSVIAERLSARQLILRRISEIVCMYVCIASRK